MKTESPYSYALVENVLTAIAFLPLLYLEFVFPVDYFAWVLVGVSSILWVLVTITNYHAYKHTPVTLKDPISQSSVLFVFALSILFLSESITLLKISGIILVFSGLVLITFKNQNLFGGFFDKGVQLTLLTAFLSSVVVIVDKVAMKYFTPGTYGFLVYLIPSLILIAFLKNRKDETKNLLKNRWPYVALIVVLGVSVYYFSLKAYSLADASIVFPIIRLSTIFGVFGGLAIFEEERKNIFRKIIAIAIIIAGVLLVSGSLF
jgi:drug/metabolite transporter (DMT)-like permease